METKGRRASKNVVDLRSNDPMFQTAQRLSHNNKEYKQRSLDRYYDLKAKHRKKRQDRLNSQVTPGEWKTKDNLK